MANASVTSVDQLRETYEPPRERAVAKQLDRLDRHCHDFLARAPFCTLATAGADGKADCSPRGDLPGFVKAADDRTLLIPDRPGNNRLDSLSNIVENPEVGLLFMVPGFNETLRVNGRAKVLKDPALCAEFAVNGKPARVVVRVAVREVYFHCAKTLIRAKLWDSDSQQDREEAPSLGRILTDQTKLGSVDDAEVSIAESMEKRLW
jgi:PPOX class probable FMN-dependent enzyme